MIKINLLGDEETTSADSIIWLGAFAGSVIITVIFWFAVRSLVSGSIDDSNHRIASAEVSLAGLRDRTKEVDDLKKTKDELQAMTLAVASLRKAQEGPVRLLDSLNIAVPPRLWLLSIDSKVDTMKIEGLSLDDSSISDFIKNFRISDLVLEADLRDRRAVSLVQINTFNSFSGEQTKAVVRADKAAVQSKLTEVKKEAEDAGLLYKEGIPESALKEAVAGANEEGLEGKEKLGGITKLSFNSGNKNKFVGGRPTVFAWQSLDEVKGLSFVVEAKIQYSAVKVDIDALLAPKVGVPKAEEKKKSKESKESKEDK